VDDAALGQAPSAVLIWPESTILELNKEDLVDLTIPENNGRMKVSLVSPGSGAEFPAPVLEKATNSSPQRAYGGS
jgi:hypothetical protein